MTTEGTESSQIYYTGKGEKVLEIVIEGVRCTPEYTRNNTSPKLMTKLSEIDSIVGLKQSNYDISQTVEIIRLVGGKIAVLTGIDSQLYPTLCIPSVQER